MAAFKNVGQVIRRYFGARLEDVTKQLFLAAKSCGGQVWTTFQISSAQTMTGGATRQKDLPPTSSHAGRTDGVPILAEKCRTAGGDRSQNSRSALADSGIAQSPQKVRVDRGQVRRAYGAVLQCGYHVRDTLGARKQRGGDLAAKSRV